MPIDIKNLEECINEALRFLMRARAAQRHHQEELTMYRGPDKWTYGDGPSNAAARRASMDLTQAKEREAQLRKFAIDRYTCLHIILGSIDLEMPKEVVEEARDLGLVED